MKMVAISQELSSTSYPGRGIIIGRSADGSKAVTAYFIMGRSVNSRNRVFVEDGEGIRTDYLCTGQSAWQQDNCDKWRPDRYHL